MPLLDDRLMLGIGTPVLLTTPTSVSSLPSKGPWFGSVWNVAVPFAFNVIRTPQPVLSFTVGHTVNSGVPVNAGVAAGAAFEPSGPTAPTELPNKGMANKANDTDAAAIAARNTGGRFFICLAPNLPESGVGNLRQRRGL